MLKPEPIPPTFQFAIAYRVHFRQAVQPSLDDPTTCILHKQAKLNLALKRAALLQRPTPD